MALPDFIRESLARAPKGEEDLSPDELAELEQRSADMRAGRVQGIEREGIRRTIVAMEKLAG